MPLVRRLTKRRWDSSDPDRAPPPLPLNPQSPGVSPSRSGASAAIQSAHAALTEKARENALVPALARRMNDSSPERALASRGNGSSPHKRMQSLQPGTVRDMSFLLEAPRDSGSPTPKSPDKVARPSTPVRGWNDKDMKPADKDRQVTGTPASGPKSQAQSMRASARRPQSILGENTPPQSSTMLALQNMPSSSSRELDSPLAAVTNNSTALAKTNPAHENISTQISSLTSIATALQRDVQQLSRRSRDNAADLMSLKEATHARDEDIRKSLRELVINIDTPKLPARDPYSGLFLDNKPHNSPPISKSAKPFTLPRIPSPNSFATSIDRESSMGTPSLIGGDSPATLALLEKIIREMSTKDGQETLINRLSEIAEKLPGSAALGKVEELIDQLQSANHEQSIVPVGAAHGSGAAEHGRARNFALDEERSGNRELGWNHGSSGLVSQRVGRLLNKDDDRRSSVPGARAADLLNEDILKIIRAVKDSVAQGGGLTAEVKALVRELRGEVLGMGREIGRRLDEVYSKTSTAHEVSSRDELANIVEQGLEQMGHHMNRMLTEHRRSSASSTKSVIDYNEIYNAMRAALQDSESGNCREPELNRDDIISAVKEAWEAYEPEKADAQRLGLDREEVLACLKEGLQEYPHHDEGSPGATQEEVFQAVVEGLKHFVPPAVDSPASLSRDEILEAVRECLEEFEFPVAPSALNNDLTRDDMLDAVKEGLRSSEFAGVNAPASSRKEAGPEIVEQLRDIMELMREEFKAVSEEAKQNVAANGRDTEQVLDATKDGFEQLRTHLEGYVDRVSNAAAHEGSTMSPELIGFRDELAGLISKASDESTQLLKLDLESLHEAVGNSVISQTQAPTDNTEILDVLHGELDKVLAELLRSQTGTTDILDALQEGFGDLRATIEKIHDRPVELPVNEEILDALKSGLDGVRSDIDTLRESSSHERAVATADTAARDAIVAADLLKQEDIKNLEVMMTQLRIKVEAMESTHPGPAVDGLSRNGLDEMEDLLRSLQESVAGVSSRIAEPSGSSEDAATKDDAQAIETLLRNTKARLDDLIDGEQAVRKDHVDAVEALVLETKDSLGSLATHLESVSHKEDIVAVESLVTQVTAALDEMKDRAEKIQEDPERVTKTDVDAIEAVCLDMKSIMEQTLKEDTAWLASKEDLKSVEQMVSGVKEHTNTHAETAAKAFEERQAEIVGVGERVSEVKTFLEEFQILVKERLESGGTGIDALAKALDELSGTINKNAGVGDDLKDMFEHIKSEFEESKAGVVGAKMDADEKFQQTTETLGTKFDERIGELMMKYEGFQAAAEERAKSGEARDTEMEASVVGTRAVADELKVLVDTLGSAVTESLEKMEEASKTVFERVDDLYNKAETTHSDGKNEHQMTRDQVQQAISAVEGVQGHVCEYQPKILESVKDVLLVVGQHYEHSKSAAVDIQQKIDDANLLKEKDEQQLLPPVEKYDDTEVHSKLDKLVDHTQAAGRAYAQLDTLDKVHQQVLQTAADISSFLGAQTQRGDDEKADRERSLQETTVALERRRAEKDQLEIGVIALREEEADLRNTAGQLKAEQALLTRQKTQLTADVSSLETALRIRREELQAMEARAQGLERRILEGVLDHSRALLITKSGNKGRDAMSRKRVSPAATGPPSPSEAPPASTKLPRHKKAVDMAVSGNRASLIPPSPASTSRRILSLNQIAHNVPAGGFKRSQSVRAPTGGNGGLRKNSWGGGRASLAVSGNKAHGVELAEEDKENLGSTLTEETEPEASPPPSSTQRVTPGFEAATDDGRSETATVEEDGDMSSDAGTLRRSSLGTTVISGTETEGAYTDDQSDWTESAGGTGSDLGTESVADSESVAGEDGALVPA